MSFEIKPKPKESPIYSVRPSSPKNGDMFLDQMEPELTMANKAQIIEVD
jgi:hypothetical protein